MRARRRKGWLRAGVGGAASLVLLAFLAPVASGHGESGGPLGPQQVSGPGGTLADAATQDHCDPIDPHACLLPFPNDDFTRPDAATATGRRLLGRLSAAAPRRFAIDVCALRFAPDPDFSDAQQIR